MSCSNQPNPDFGDIVNYEEDSDGYDEIEAHAEPDDRYYPTSNYQYYPVHVGQVFVERYQILHKLGHGGFSTVWMAHDLQERKDVALKFMVARNGAENEYHAQNEIIRKVQDLSRLVTYRATFQLLGAGNAWQRVFVFPLHGPSLETTLREMPIATRMAAARQLLVALNSLHAAGIVHRDLNTGAVMWGLHPTDQFDAATKYQYFGRPQKLPLPGDVWQYGERVKPMSVPLNMIDGRVYLGDFSLSITAGTPVNYKPQAPVKFCAPERYHGFNPSFASDMWSYMTIFGILYTGFTLFHGYDGDMAMGAWVHTLGPMPSHWKGRYTLSEGKYMEWWYDPDTPTSPKVTHAAKIVESRPDIPDDELCLALEVLSKAFCYEPDSRLTAAQLLEDPSFNALLRRYGC